MRAPTPRFRPRGRHHERYFWRQLEPLAQQTDEEVERFLSSSDADALKQLLKRVSAG